MKKILSILAACAAMALPQTTQAQGIQGIQGVYVSGFGTANFKNDFHKKHMGRVTFDAGYTVGGALGCKLNCVRLEAEFSYRRTDVNSFHLKHADTAQINGLEGKKKVHIHGNEQVWAVLGNAYYDFELNTTYLKPYVGIGLGYAHGKYSLKKIHGTRIHFCRTGDDFAWQAMAGVAYPINERVDLTMEYRYFNTNKKHNHNHNVGAGLRYWF